MPTSRGAPPTTGLADWLNSMEGATSPITRRQYGVGYHQSQATGNVAVPLRLDCTKAGNIHQRLHDPVVGQTTARRSTRHPGRLPGTQLGQTLSRNQTRLTYCRLKGFAPEL